MIILIDNMNVQKQSYVIIEQLIITDISAISYKVILIKHQDKQSKIQAGEYSKTFLVYYQPNDSMVSAKNTTQDCVNVFDFRFDMSGTLTT